MCHISVMAASPPYSLHGNAIGDVGREALKKTAKEKDMKI